MVSFDDFQRLKAQVLVKRPVLKKILEKRGSKKLFEYANEYVSVNLNPAIKSRQREFLATFGAEVSRLLGNEVAQSAVRQLRKHYFVSTADHHGPICHPFFLNSNLVTAATYPEDTESLLKNVIVLSCANVSFSNSTFPRGLLFHSYFQDTIQTHRLSFLPSNAHSASVYNFRAYTLDEIHKVKKALREKFLSGEVRQQEVDKIAVLLDEIYAQPEVLACKTYSDQVTKTNFSLWKKFFHTTKTTPPNLLY